MFSRGRTGCTGTVGSLGEVPGWSRGRRKTLAEGFVGGFTERNGEVRVLRLSRVRID